MRVFLDFEASSLGKHSYPIEVAWVFEDGSGEEAHLIRPAPGWTDWEDEAAALHGLTRDRLIAEGRAVDEVAGRMVDLLDPHQILASAPSWDGKWLSVLLRAGGFARHRLRLADTEVAFREAARERLGAAAGEDDIAELITGARDSVDNIPAEHRALADAQRERRIWLAIRGISAGLANG